MSALYLSPRWLSKPLPISLNPLLPKNYDLKIESLKGKEDTRCDISSSFLMKQQIILDRKIQNISHHSSISPLPSFFAPRPGTCPSRSRPHLARQVVFFSLLHLSSPFPVWSFLWYFPLSLLSVFLFGCLTVLLLACLHPFSLSFLRSFHVLLGLFQFLLFCLHSALLVQAPTWPDKWSSFSLFILSHPFHGGLSLNFPLSSVSFVCLFFSPTTTTTQLK